MQSECRAVGLIYAILKHRRLMSFTQLYVHAVTATKYSAPIISKRIEALIYPAICRTMREKQGTVVAVGAVHDHIHVVMRMHPAVAFSQVMRHMKARSARVALQALGKPAHFWQEGMTPSPSTPTICIGSLRTSAIKNNTTQPGTD